MNEITMLTNADPLIRMALAEDITSEDISSNAVMREAKQGEVDLICKEDGIIAGLSVFKRVFTLLDADTEVTFFCQDGDAVKQGQKMGVVRGDIRVLLSGERTALNYLQRMSGIATYTNSITKLLAGSKTKLLDTRKTTPNNRIFEKYAVKAGGDRQELHERIRELSMEAGKTVKVEGKDNNLLELIAADPAFNLSLEDLQRSMDPKKYIGRAKEQTERFVNTVVQPILDSHKELLGVKAEINV